MPTLFDAESLQKALAKVPGVTDTAERTAAGATPVKHSPFVPAMILGGNGLDGATTAYALAHGAREAYPFLPQSPMVNALMKGLTAAGELYGARELEKRGHPTAAKVLAAALGGTAALAGVSNLHQIRKLKD